MSCWLRYVHFTYDFIFIFPHNTHGDTQHSASPSTSPLSMLFIPSSIAVFDSFRMSHELSFNSLYRPLYAQFYWQFFLLFFSTTHMAIRDTPLLHLHRWCTSYSFNHSLRFSIAFNETSIMLKFIISSQVTHVLPTIILLFFYTTHTVIIDNPPLHPHQRCPCYSFPCQ